VPIEGSIENKPAKLIHTLFVQRAVIRDANTLANFTDDQGRNQLLFYR
jgi:hypothetical protein